MTVNHSLHFKDPVTGVHFNTIESTWRHSKQSMSNYCRKKSFYAGYLAKFMFTKHCRLHNLDPTTEFFKHAGMLYHVDNTEHHTFVNGDGDEDGGDGDEDGGEDDDNDDVDDDSGDSDDDSSDSDDDSGEQQDE